MAMIAAPVALWVGGGTVGAVVGAVAVGVVTGAVIGAATAVITGGSILDGALKGALVGGVTAGVVSGLGSMAANAGTQTQAMANVGGVSAAPEGFTGVATGEAFAGNVATNVTTPAVNAVTAASIGTPRVQTVQGNPTMQPDVSPVTSPVVSTTPTKPAERGFFDKIFFDDKGAFNDEAGKIVAGGIGGAAKALLVDKPETQAEYLAQVRAMNVAGTFKDRTLNIKVPDHWQRLNKIPEPKFQNQGAANA